MVELNRILCAVDFSEFSRRALGHALALGRCYGSTVTALHVIAPVPAMMAGPYHFGAEIPPPMTLPTMGYDIATQELDRLVAAEQVPGVRIEALVAEGAHVHREILAQADRLTADLVVLGTHGRSGFERLFLGSTTEKVLRKTTHPLMTVPPRMPEAHPVGTAPFTRILCGIDFSGSSRLALDYAMSLARESRAALTLAHVIETHPLYADFAPPAVIDTHAWMEEARTRLHGMVPPSVRSACPVTEAVREGSPYHELLALAKELAPDLIVLGVRGRRASGLWAFGSTTHHVIREAECAVLTLRC